METHLNVSVAAPDASDEEIVGIARELAAWIATAAPECEVAQQTTAGPEGGKGILEILGSLGVAFLQPGALKSLIDCLAVYIKERRREVGITLQTPSGASVTLNAGGIRARELDGLLGQLRQMIEGDRVARA
jgi:hypothetical protein